MKFLYLILASATFTLTACGEPSPEERELKMHDATLVREIEGCKIWRFSDRYTVYFSDCRGGIETHSTSTVSNGKTGYTKHRRTQTLNTGRK